MKRFRFSAALMFAAASPVVSFAAEPTDPTNAAIFAGGNLTFNSFCTVTGGPVIANGNVQHNGGTLNVPSIYSGGTFNAGGAAFQDVTGDTLFDGTISNFGGPGSVFGGNVTSAQGGVQFFDSSETVGGNVTAAGSVGQPFAFSKIQGNVLAGGDAVIGGIVGGSVTYGGIYTPGPFASVAGSVTQGGPVYPTPYVPLTLPAGSNLTAGANNVTLTTFQSMALSPGTYGTLTFASGNTVSLTSGDYVFAGIQNTFDLNNLSFNTSNGPIHVYIAGDCDFNLVEVLNGISLFAGTTPNPVAAESVYFETAGNFTADAPLYGNISAPDGNITIDDFDSITGHVVAGGNVTIGDANVTLVPEPATLANVVMALVGASLRRRGRVSIKTP